ncbi:MAG: hypothetical protein HQK55_01865 [Deltaproteobacteria bacterium]|nr:hypothetical protein [Deltaproteobacteria bacterium]
MNDIRSITQTYTSQGMMNNIPLTPADIQHGSGSSTNERTSAKSKPDTAKSESILKGVRWLAGQPDLSLKQADNLTEQVAEQIKGTDIQNLSLNIYNSDGIKMIRSRYV